MPEPMQLLLGLGVPLLIAAALAWIGGMWPRGSAWGAIAGLAIGLFVAYGAFMSRRSPLPAVEAPERIVVCGIGIAIAGILLCWRSVPWIARGLLAIAAQVLILWFVFRPMPASSLPPEKMWTFVAITAGVGLVLTALIETTARRSGSVAAALVLGPLASGVGAINILTGNAKLGWLGASIGVMIFGWFVAALISKNVSLSRGPVIVCLAILSALLAYGYFSSETMTPLYLALVAGAPVLAMIAEAPPIHRMRSWKRELIRIVLVTIPIGVAVGIAIPRFIRENSASSELQEM
jgi:hypothetical protein